MEASANIKSPPSPVLAKDRWKNFYMSVAVGISISVSVMGIAKDQAAPRLPVHDVFRLDPNTGLLDFKNGHCEHRLEHVIHGFRSKDQEPMGDLTMHRKDHFLGKTAFRTSRCEPVSIQ